VSSLLTHPAGSTARACDRMGEGRAVLLGAYTPNMRRARWPARELVPNLSLGRARSVRNLTSGGYVPVERELLPAWARRPHPRAGSLAAPVLPEAELLGLQRSGCSRKAG
jgi:hypothetical protein